MSASTDFVSTVLIIISLFTRIQAEYSCDDIFTGKVSPPPDCSHSHDDPEIDSRCRIDLGVHPVGRNALHILDEGLKSNVRLCFGCSEDNFYGQCNTVIACHPQTVCYYETHTNHDSATRTRHRYGCMWESSHVSSGGHHCSQPDHGSASGTRTCSQPKLCNGGPAQLNHISNLIYSLHPTTTTSTKPTITTVTTTTTTPKPTTTTVPTTTTPKPTTFPTTKSTQKPISTPLTSTTCKQGDGKLKCADFNDPPYFTCSQYDHYHNNTLCSLTSGHDRAVKECPQYCGFCDEYCQLLYNAQGLTTPTTTPSTTPTPIPTTTTVTTTTTTPKLTTTTVPSATSTPKPITTSVRSIPCKQGNGTLMCMDHDNPPYFVCKTFDQDSGLCGWTSSGHDRAVDQCPLYCGFCDEYCQKLYDAQVQTTPPTTTTSASTLPPTTTPTTTQPTTTTTTTAAPTTTSTTTTTTTTTQPTTTSTTSSTTPPPPTTTTTAAPTSSSTTTTTQPTTTTTQPTTTPTTAAPITSSSTITTTTTSTQPTTTITTESSTAAASTTLSTSEPATSTTAAASTGPPCVDTDTTCAGMASFLCTASDPVSQAYAKQSCAKTCNFCGQSATTTISTITPAQCVDHDINNNCGSMANVLCNSKDVHTMNYAIANCAKTCNLCTEYLQQLAGANIPLLG